MANPVALGPFRGVNNVDARNSAVFQLPITPESPPPFLRAALNVDLDRQGWPRKRQGRTRVVELTDGHSGFAFGPDLFVMDAGRMLRVQGSTVEELYAGLGDSRVSFCSTAGQVFWCNGKQRGRIVQGAAALWGTERPQITVLGQSAGPLRSGRYMVAVTAEEADGLESGALPAQPIDLTQGAIIVNITPSSAPFINIYVSDPDGASLFWVRRAPTDTFPLVINEVSLSTDLLDSVGLGPPPLGHVVREFRGRMLVADGSVLWFSSPLSPHLFRKSTDFQLFESRIVMLEPLTEGFFVATLDATYWVEGLEPAEWRPRVVDRRKVAEGPGLRLSGRKIEGLNAEAVYRRVQQPAQEVVLWMTEDGPAFGMAGQVQLMFDGQVAVEKAERAALGFREIGGLRQVLMSLQQPTENVFASSDRVTCTVIKAGEG